MGLIYHLVVGAAWDTRDPGAPYAPASLASEGFVHASTIEQVVATAHRYYDEEQDLRVLCIDEDALTVPVRYEPPSGPPRAGRELYPHVYGPIEPRAIVRVIRLERDAAGRFAFSDPAADVERP
jgi:uncharacterized protein (DUF952 family)